MGLAVTKQEAFWEACGFGHKERVRKFIAEGIDVNWVSYTHSSCAIHVASQGKKEIVQMLLDAGCNVNAVDDRGNLALHHAAMKGHADIIQMLIDAGSNIDAQDKNGWTALINAAYFCQPSAVQVLLDNHCSITVQNKDSRTALHEACRSPCTDEESLCRIAKLLIAAGSDLNTKSSDVGEADFTPLMFCAYHGHHLIAEALIEAGCDMNACGTNEWTALHWAADRSQKAVVEVLLRANIDPLAQGKRGELATNRAQNDAIRDLLRQAVTEAEIRLGRIPSSSTTEMIDDEVSKRQRSTSETSDLQPTESDLGNVTTDAESHTSDSDSVSSLANSEDDGASHEANNHVNCLENSPGINGNTQNHHINDNGPGESVDDDGNCQHGSNGSQEQISDAMNIQCVIASGSVTNHTGDTTSAHSGSENSTSQNHHCVLDNSLTTAVKLTDSTSLVSPPE